MSNEQKNLAAVRIPDHLSARLQSLQDHARALSEERGDLESVLRDLSALMLIAKAAAEDTVHEARRRAVPWSQIGAAMNVSTQAAQQRFGTQGRVKAALRTE